MSREPMREVVVQTALNDAYDGVIRLLNDAQRSGFELRAMTLEVDGDETASATLTLSIPACVDAQLLVARLARHPTVRHLGVQGNDAEANLTYLYAVAA